MPIYTKKGDNGRTKLPYDRRKRSKSSCRVQSLGEIDELNSLIGVVIAFTKQKQIKTLLYQVQHDLFRVQLEISSKGAAFGDKKIKPISLDNVAWLERHIDALSKKLPALAMFIVPGGSKAASLAQLARAVCRRAERELAGLNKKEPVNAQVLAYMNRLSDFLFTIARTLNKQGKIKESYPDYYESLRAARFAKLQRGKQEPVVKPFSKA